jgi:hypothetical protein
MNVLLDEGVPAGLKPHIRSLGHECEPAREAGLTSKKNGELLALAERRWDVLLTTDRKIRYEQNLTNRNIAILILAAKSNRLADLLPLIPSCNEALRSIRAGQIFEIT